MSRPGERGVDRSTIEAWIRRWVTSRCPAAEGAGGSEHLARAWAQLDALESAEAEGVNVRVRFVWSEHRESEFTVYTDAGDESLVARQTTELLLDPDGQPVER